MKKIWFPRKHLIVFCSRTISFSLLSFLVVAAVVPCSKTTAFLASSVPTVWKKGSIGWKSRRQAQQQKKHDDDISSFVSSSSYDGSRSKIPRDIHYDEKAANALKNLRLNIDRLQQRRKERLEEEEVRSPKKKTRNNFISSSDDDSKSDDEIITAALKELDSSGDWEKTTMTLIGYKGGPMNRQVNQDRSILVSPVILQGGTNNNIEISFDDDVIVKKRQQLEERIAFLGVLDGHGGRGEIVSEFARTEIPKRLVEKFQNLYNSDNDRDTQQSKTKRSLTSFLNGNVTATKNIIAETFLQVDELTPAGDDGGCSCSIAIQIGRKLYVANVGDSTTIVAKYSSKKTKDRISEDDERRETAVCDNKEDDKVLVLYKTREDKPDLPEERERIESNGGEVFIPEDSNLDSSRVLYENHGRLVGLSMSRSIGDHSAPGVIALPTIDVFDIPELLSSYSSSSFSGISMENDDVMMESGNKVKSDDRLFVVSFTDGMADYIAPDDVANFMAKSLYDDYNTQQKRMHPHNAAEQLIYIASKGWTRDMGGKYRDDITISASMIVYEE